MSKKLLVDTNILLDSAIGERSGWGYAVLLMDEFAYSKAKGYVSSLSLKDVYYILSKYADEKSAREFILAVLDLFEVVSVDSTVCRMAALSDEPDFEDGIIRVCAEQIGADLIISRDEHAFERSTIKRLSAQEYLELFCDVEEIKMP